MPLRMVFTATERERLAVIVNNLCFYASQIILQGSPVLSQRALSNLAKTKNEEEALLKRLDEVAREQSDESPHRVIEDLAHLPNDVVQMMTLVGRCRMSVLDIAVIGFLSLVVLIAVGMIGLVAAYRH